VSKSMSRFIISDHKFAYEGISTVFDKYFERSCNGNLLGSEFSVWYKKNGSEQNSILPDEDVAFYVGTLEYNGKVGTAALYDIYNDFSKDNFPEILKKSSGCFSVVLKKSDRVYVFVDPSATFKVYYLNSGIAISNNLYGLASGYSEILGVNEVALVEQAFQYSVLGNETIFRGVSKLESGDLYSYDKESKFKVKKHNIFREIPTDDQCLAEILKRKASLIGQSYRSVSVNMTGGLDSRTVLSSFLSSEISPSLVYGVGNSAATNTKSSDEKIVSRFSNRFDLDHLNLDWKLKDRFIQDWDELLEEYGEFFTAYCGNINLIRGYERSVSAISDYTCFGYFGETLRNIEKVESSGLSHFTVESLVKSLYLYHGPNFEFLGDLKKNYLENIFRKVRLICEEEGLDKNCLSKDDFQIIHNRYRSEADSKMSGLVNSFMYSSVFLSGYDVQNIVERVTYSDKFKARFQINLIRNLFPDALHIPLFSHGRQYKIDFKTLKMTAPISWKEFLLKIPLVSENREFLRKIKGKGGRAVGQSLGVYDRAWLNNRVVDLQNIMSINAVQPEKYNGDIRALIYYLMYLYLLNKVFNKGYVFPYI